MAVPPVKVCGPPHNPSPETLEDSYVLVIDVLRATTTLTRALAQGAEVIIPTRDPRKALQMRDAVPGAVAGGERQAMPLPGFDFGNSPLDYSRTRVEGRTVVLCSTNGTGALLSASQARVTTAAAFVNLDAAAAGASNAALPVMLICAGQEGDRSLEDDAFAGCLIEAMGAAAGNNRAGSCLEIWRTLKRNPAAVFEESSHGRYLASIGCGKDLEYCAQVSVEDVLPKWSQGKGGLTL